MRTILVGIEGTSPLLSHRWSEDSEQSGEQAARNVMVKHGTPREQAEKVAYKTAKGEFYFPGASIARLLREAGSGHKLKGSRKSAKYVVPAAVIVMDDVVLLRNGDGKTLVKDYEVDSRPVVIPATKGRIMRHRPRFDKWSATFTLRVNEKLLPLDFVNQLVVEGGQQIGVGDFRPEKGGPFGTFNLVSWDPQK